MVHVQKTISSNEIQYGNRSVSLERAPPEKEILLSGREKVTMLKVTVMSKFLSFVFDS